MISNYIHPIFSECVQVVALEKRISYEYNFNKMIIQITTLNITGE